MHSLLVECMEQPRRPSPVALGLLGRFASRAVTHP